MSRSRDLQLLHGVVLVWSGAEDAKTASSIVQRHVHSAQHRLICIDPQRSSERPLPPSAWPSNKLGQRGVFAIKWTVLLIHKTPIIKVILVQFPLQSLRTSYVSPGSMTQRLWLHPAEVPFSTVAFSEISLAGGLLTAAVMCESSTAAAMQASHGGHDARAARQQRCESAKETVPAGARALRNARATRRQRRESATAAVM